jgi:hypothetical protein
MRAYTEVDDDQWALMETILDNPPSAADWCTVAPYHFEKISRKSAKKFTTGSRWASSLASHLLLSIRGHMLRRCSLRDPATIASGRPLGVQ